MRPPPQNPRASELWFRVRKDPRSDSWITFGNLIKAFFSLNEWLWRWLNCWFWIQWMEYRHYLGEQLRLGCSSAQLQARGGNPWIKTLRKLNCVASLFENLSLRQPSASSWCIHLSPPALPPVQLVLLKQKTNCQIVTSHLNYYKSWLECGVSALDILDLFEGKLL